MSRLADAVGDHPELDFAAAVGLGALAALKTRPLAALEQSERLAIYGSAGEVVGIVAGLGAIAVSVHLAGSGQRARALREAQGGSLRRNWFFVALASALSAVSAWGAQIIDAAGLTALAWGVVCGAISWATFTFVRQAWLFVSLMRINDADTSTKATVEPKTELGLAWLPSHDPRHERSAADRAGRDTLAL